MKLKKAITIVFHTLVVVAFFVALVIAIIITNGYQLDFFAQNFTKTSIIDLSIEVPEGQIFLDGKLLSGEPPLKIFNVFPGKHQLEVVKDGFLTWKYEVDVQADFVSILRNHLIFPDLDVVEWEKVGDLLSTDSKWVNNTLVKKTELGALEFYQLRENQLVMLASFEGEGGSFEKLNAIGSEFFVENESEVKIYNLSNQAVSVVEKDFSVISYLGDHWLLDGQNYLLVYDRNMDNVLQKYDFDQIIETVNLIQKDELTFLKVKFVDEDKPKLLVLRGSELKMLAENLDSEMIVSEENKILLMDNGQLVLFDAVFNKLVLARFNQKLDLVDWAAEGAFVFRQNNQLFLSDLDFKNTQVIVKDAENIVDLKIAPGQLYKISTTEQGQEISLTEW
ncbi:MAG: PEGA domain-containing protein [Candidatus Altimarinota bacterium]